MELSELNFDDMHRVLAFLPKDIIKMMRVHPIFLAGGFIRSKVAGESVSDIDLFAGNADECKTYGTALAADRNVSSFRTRNAITILSPPRVPVQFIHRWTFKEPAALIESFDFTVARACVWFDRDALLWRSLIDQRFYADLASRRLRYCSPAREEDAGGSLLRVQKFIKKGYDIAPEEFGRVIARLIEKVNPETRVWQESEAGKARVLGGLLRQVDPLTLIDGLTPTDDSLEEPPLPEPIAAQSV